MWAPCDHLTKEWSRRLRSDRVFEIQPNLPMTMDVNEFPSYSFQDVMSRCEKAAKAATKSLRAPKTTIITEPSR